MVQWTPVESEMGVIFLGSMRVNSNTDCTGKFVRKGCVL